MNLECVMFWWLEKIFVLQETQHNLPEGDYECQVFLDTWLAINSSRPGDAIEFVSISSGNDLAPFRRQAITWTNANLSSIRHIRIYSTKFYSKFKHIHWRQCFWKCRLQNGDQFVQASIYLKGKTLPLAYMLREKCQSLWTLNLFVPESVFL